MTFRTQLRRTAYSFAALAVFAAVAVAQGENLAPGPQARFEAVACETVALPEPMVADRGDAARPTDWRALMPAMIFRTRN